MIRLILAIIFASNSSYAQSNGKMSVISVLPFAAANLSDVIVDSQVRVSRSDSDVTYLDIYLSCFGTNLRGVSNPLARNSDVIATITYQDQGGGYQDYVVTFPSNAAFSSAAVNEPLTDSHVRGPGGVILQTWKATLNGNLVRAEMKKTKTLSVDVSSSGTVFGAVQDVNAKSDLIQAVRFEQRVTTPTAGQYVGMDGPLSANLSWYASENGKYITIYASFPGENKNCGGYYSPLMLSFDDAVPSLENSTQFLLNKEDRKSGTKLKYSWPSFKGETYFLALDLNKNGKIDGGHELFGDINGYQNGFENLALYDENKDGVIDKNDKVFNQLVLWRDVNGDGISQKKELFKLSDFGVQSISLSFANETRYEGKRGKILGPASFDYVNKKNEKKKGKVWDVFLTVVP
ncbi:hypothetical protein D3C87_109530 [compost metagenome]